MAKEGKKKDKAAEPKPPKSNDYGIEAPSENGGGDRFVAKDHIGELLLIYPKELIVGMVTAASPDPVDVIQGDVVVLNKSDPTASERIDNTLIFGQVVVNQMRDKVGRAKVLGTWEQVETKGGRTPWNLRGPSDDDVTVAKAYLDFIDPLR